MKVFKTTEGNLSLVFSKEETENIINLFQKPESINDNSENPYHHLRVDSILFIKDLKEKFGKNPISRKDGYLKMLERKYYIKDIAQLLRNLSSRRFCTIVKDSNSNIPSGRINYFTLDF